MATQKLQIYDLMSEAQEIAKSHFRHYLPLFMLFILPLSFTIVSYPTLQHSLATTHSNSSLFFPFSGDPFVFKPLGLFLLYISTLLCLSVCAIGTFTYSLYHGSSDQPVKSVDAIKSLSNSLMRLFATFLCAHAIIFVQTLSYRADLMEAVKESGTGGGIMGTIRAPRLEDAGLEDCALSPDSIKQAFFKAANSIRSFVSDETDSKGGCIQDRGPTNPKSGDSLIGTDPAPDPPGSCENEKGGGLPDVVGDKVGVGVPGPEEEGVDKLLGDIDEESSGKKACIDDGLEGLKIDEDDEEEIEADGDEDEKKSPILAEVLI